MDNITYHRAAAGVDWAALKRCLSEDRFDNGRTPEQLERSFRNTRHVCFAFAAGAVVGTARLLSDDVCNAYLVDVWTYTPYRRRGIASEMIRLLLAAVPGQHVYLQADTEQRDFYLRHGFEPQPHGLSRVVGRWLHDNTSDTTDEGV
jgi:GNAT superfamily N-acetyltransferase